jgi:hypothetical protein
MWAILLQDLKNRFFPVVEMKVSIVILLHCVGGCLRHLFMTFPPFIASLPSLPQHNLPSAHLHSPPFRNPLPRQNSLPCSEFPSAMHPCLSTLPLRLGNTHAPYQHHLSFQHHLPSLALSSLSASPSIFSTLFPFSITFPLQHSLPSSALSFLLSSLSH